MVKSEMLYNLKISYIPQGFILKEDVWGDWYMVYDCREWWIQIYINLGVWRALQNKEVKSSTVYRLTIAKKLDVDTRIVHTSNNYEEIVNIAFDWINKSLNDLLRRIGIIK